MLCLLFLFVKGKYYYRIFFSCTLHRAKSLNTGQNITTRPYYSDGAEWNHWVRASQKYKEGHKAAGRPQILIAATYAECLVSAEVPCTRLFVQSLSPDVRVLRPLRRPAVTASDEPSLYHHFAAKENCKKHRGLYPVLSKAGQIVVSSSWLVS